MTAFRTLLVLIFVAISAYTAVTVSQHGMNLMPVFFGDMSAFGWPGQFNFDFMTMLTISALWTAWRNEFTPKGWVLAVFAFLLGGLFLSAYLLHATFECDGDMKAVVLGKARATA